MARMFSWVSSMLKGALPTSFAIGNLTTSFGSSSRYFERLLSFASSQGGHDDAASATELQGAAPGGVLQGPQPDVSAATASGGRDIEIGGMTVPELRQPNVPAAAAGDDRRTITELAIPAVLSMGVYSSIPVDVQLHRGGGVRFLYYPLLTFIALAVGSSLCIIFYALTRFEGGGREEEEVESAKRRWMRISIVFFLLAFILRVCLAL